MLNLYTFSNSILKRFDKESRLTRTIVQSHSVYPSLTVRICPEIGGLSEFTAIDQKQTNRTYLWLYFTHYLGVEPELDEAIKRNGPTGLAIRGRE